MMAYRRDRRTWAAFGALFAFGLLNAVLGPALPYLRAAEHISYVVGALHQAAYAIGGGLAGLLAARAARSVSRGAVIAGGLSGAAIAGLGVGYGTTPALTIAAAFVMSLLATSALIRLWAVLADLHGPRRAVAMTEGEVSVSLAGIVRPLLIGALAATALRWSFAVVLGLATAAVAVVCVWRAGMPPPAYSRQRPLCREPGRTPCGQPPRSPRPPGAAPRRRARHHAARTAHAAGGRRRSPGRPRHRGDGDRIGAMFPLTSALHVTASPRTADNALGQVLGVASIGQLAGPLVAGAIAQAAGLRAGLLILPILTLIAAAGLHRHVAARRRPAPAEPATGERPPVVAGPGVRSRRRATS